MCFDRFIADYGILPSAYFGRSAITNPIELFWSDDLLALLLLCGAKEETVGKRASDYDRFLSLCRALPLLQGHPTRAWIASVLEKYFDLKELPTEATAAEIWKKLCVSLIENPISPRDLVSGAWLCDEMTLPSSLPEQVTPVLNANLLLDTNAKTAATWTAEIASTVANFAKNRCETIVLHLSNGFRFISPSLYGVDRALSLSKRDREATDLLTSQLVRELSAAAQEQNLLLVLVCDNNSASAVNLLEYVEKSVGLPQICWVLREAKDAQSLLNFTAKAHKNEIFAALAYDNVMTARELDDVLDSWQMRYPIGRLCYVTARDLRQTPWAQAHISALLRRTKIKI